MKDDNIRLLWEEFTIKYDIKYDIKNTDKSNDEIWKDKLLEVEKYINDNNKLPSKCDKNKQIKSLGIWIQHQKTNYNKKLNIMKDDNIRLLWEEFTIKL